ncbi:MAG: RNA polymerase sigma factor [Gemmatimonadetes bacterium]|nr:RNA polymerase sigma factor [Gemmatimonadota bacterium]
MRPMRLAVYLSSDNMGTLANILSVDELAIQRAKTGDADALEGLFRAYEGTVYSLARRMCRTAEDAEDVLQETFFEVCRSISRFRGTEGGSLTAWIKRIAASKALIRHRSAKYRDTEPLDDEAGEGIAVGEAPPDVGLQLDLEAALARLSDTSRSVVWMHDVEGYTHEEIAELMGKTVSFSKSQLARAHTRLKKMLGKELTQ